VDIAEDNSEDKDKDILQGRGETIKAGGFIDIKDIKDLYRI